MRTARPVRYGSDVLMSASEWATTLSSVAATLAFFVFAARQRRAVRELGERICAELGQTTSLTLPELVAKLGFEDGFRNRGKVMTAINPLVSKGVLAQDEPPGTTMKTRLDVLRFQLTNPPVAEG